MILTGTDGWVQRFFFLQETTIVAHNQNAPQHVLIDEALLIVRTTATKIKGVCLDEGAEIFSNVRITKNIK